ncbi:adenylate kinase isoenzyme 5 [Epargyreus clarus]|uniref:adenylate kinase isoenzyme 5 n=1 Tax=Epargyreus clarus TaxID=520877 RepID=UPI003C2FD934
MGICLDTEQNNEELETSGVRTRRESGWGRATPPDTEFPMQNATHVKFEPPSVPVIFVLGGPGSGKVTHCDNLMQERRGVVHINMTDLLQQYAIGNDMQDFGTLSSKTVTEVLMLEMKMAPSARTYLVSGYPRSMRDVAEYSDKIQTISGVILVSWRQRVLERQIEYGARLGHVVLSLARMELNNFYKNVIPVADYFDQSNMLVAVNGERNPDEVYKDFRAAVLQILGPLEDQTMNGVNAVGVGASGIPGEIVGVEPAPARHVEPDQDLRSEDIEVENVDPLPAPVTVAPVPIPIKQHKLANGHAERMVSPKPEVIRVRGVATTPPTLWVVGGPGSNKATLCQRAVAQRQGWTHFSLGQRLRALADAGGTVASDGALARQAVSGGELVTPELAARLVRGAVGDAARSGHGLVLDGYPRDLEQMRKYEQEFNVYPRMVLLDCSKLQLGRGRRDDSVAAFRRRLEVFRELSLPMLKSLDQDHRLVIVDGDTDSADVQAEFTRVLLEEMEKAEAIAAMPQPPDIRPVKSNTQNLTHLPNSDTAMQHFAHAMSRMGGALANGGTGNGALHNGNIGNGFIGMTNNKVKPLMNNGPRIPTISQMTHDDVRRLYEQSSGDITMNTHI